MGTKTNPVEEMYYRSEVSKEGHIFNYAFLSDDEKLIYQKIKGGELPPTMLQFCDPTEI